MIVVLTGPPGAGKGTQADLVSERMRFRKVSTGDALRKHVKTGTEIGKIAGAIMAQGKLVPDDVLFGVLKEELGTESHERVLLDGYPRNVEQAKTLDQLSSVHPVRAAIHLDVERNDLVARLSGRRVCGKCGATFHVLFNKPKKLETCDNCFSTLIQRDDDKPASVNVRLDVFEDSTRPVLNYYERSGKYFRVNGGQSMEVVYQDIVSQIERVI